jgi:hypothetical protein
LFLSPAIEYCTQVADFPIFDFTGAEIKDLPVDGDRSLAGSIHAQHHVTRFVDSSKVTHHGWHLIVGPPQRPLLYVPRQEPVTDETVKLQVRARPVVPTSTAGRHPLFEAGKHRTAPESIVSRWPLL